MLKRPETIVCGDIGLVLLSGLGSRRTHPVGAEGATMARRAPFPLNSIPAYIDQPMKLFVCPLQQQSGDRSSGRAVQRILITLAYSAYSVLKTISQNEPYRSGNARFEMHILSYFSYLVLKKRGVHILHIF